MAKHIKLKYCSKLWPRWGQRLKQKNAVITFHRQVKVCDSWAKRRGAGMVLLWKFMFKVFLILFFGSRTFGQLIQGGEKPKTNIMQSNYYYYFLFRQNPLCYKFKSHRVCDKAVRRQVPGFSSCPWTLPDRTQRVVLEVLASNKEQRNNKKIK